MTNWKVSYWDAATESHVVMEVKAESAIAEGQTVRFQNKKPDGTIEMSYYFTNVTSVEKTG